MKLYYKPGACSLASHILLRELGLDHSLEQVNTETQTTETGQDYRAVNPKGYVPALALDSGQVLTEGAAILQYLAAQSPAFYNPAPGSVALAQLQGFLNYTASELHKAFGPLFSPAADAAAKAAAVQNVGRKFDYIESQLAEGRSYLLGEDFSAADAYLFVVSNWANFVEIDLSGWPKLAAFVARVAERPAVQQAMRTEGLLS